PARPQLDLAQPQACSLGDLGQGGQVLLAGLKPTRGDRRAQCSSDDLAGAVQSVCVRCVEGSVIGTPDDDGGKAGKRFRRLQCCEPGKIVQTLDLGLRPAGQNVLDTG